MISLMISIFWILLKCSECCLFRFTNRGWTSSMAVLRSPLILIKKHLRLFSWRYHCLSACLCHILHWHTSNIYPLRLADFFRPPLHIPTTTLRFSNYHGGWIYDRALTSTPRPLFIAQILNLCIASEDVWTWSKHRACLWWKGRSLPLRSIYSLFHGKWQAFFKVVWSCLLRRGSEKASRWDCQFTPNMGHCILQDCTIQSFLYFNAILLTYTRSLRSLRESYQWELEHLDYIRHRSSSSWRQ